MKERYHVTGMTCSACSSHVEKSVNKLEGIAQASVNLLTETMDVDYDENVLQKGDIVAAVKKAGYGAMLMSGGDDAGHNTEADLQNKMNQEEKAMRLRLGISIVFLIPLMYVAMYHMLQDWFGVPIPDIVMKAFHGNENAMNFALTQFLLLLPILYMNRNFFIVGFKTLIHRSPNMDSLIALGAGAALGYGLFAMYRISYGLGHGDLSLVEHYAHDLYFESAGTILTLITVGKYLESRSKGKTGEAIIKLMKLAPKLAIVLTETGEEKEIPTELLQKGDIFLLKPGSTVPVDGTVIDGISGIDESAITGESVPVEKRKGDRVVSATLNKAGFLKCRADRVGDETTLSQIIRLVEEASASKAPIAQLADKVAGVFVPMVICISVITLIGWMMAGADVEFAISTAIAVLVISCPCALGLATPVAIMVGTGVGSNHGILIKSGEALQQAKGIDTVVLDKTGTITEGKLQVVQVKVIAKKISPTASKNGLAKMLSQEQLLYLAATLESRSEHPLAEAVINAAGERMKGNRNLSDSGIEINDFKAVFGRGIEGRLSADWLAAGKYFVGNLAYMTEQKVILTDEVIAVADAMADEGQTPLIVANEKYVLGIIGVADTLKESSGEAIAAWRDMGVDVIMLTGDNKRTAEAVRRKLKLTEVIAEVLPRDKERKISELKAAGHRVAMIGDGINDAPALAAADVGMAIGAGTDVAMESADIILMKSDLRDAVTAMRLSRAVIRNIKQNLFWAFFYNCIGIPLAAGLLYPIFEIRLTPMFGAAAMSVSSIFVVGNALRLRGFKSGFKAEIKQEEDTERSTNMIKVMTIEGMMCGHCTGRVQKTLEAIEGVGGVVMSLENKTATLTLTANVEDEVLTAAVMNAGYEVTGIEQGMAF